MTYAEYVASVATVMETVGVVTMLVGTAVAAVMSVRRARREGGTVGYRVLRRSVGKAILLGLEFLVAADIIRTVSEVPTLEKVTVLAVIVAIRTFLSFALELELEGRWPWQRGRDRDQPGRGPLRASTEPDAIDG
jgi:uncharacterized membrane protein